MRALLLFFMVSFFSWNPNIAWSQEQYSHLDLVNALKDAYPNTDIIVTGYSCDEVNYEIESGLLPLSIGDCELIMAGWPQRKLVLQQEATRLAEEEAQKKEDLKERLGLTEEELSLFKEMLK